MENEKKPPMTGSGPVGDAQVDDGSNGAGAPPAVASPGIHPAFKALLPIAVGLTIVLAAHISSLEGPFFWDDESLVLENPAVRNGASLADWFFKPFWPAELLQHEARGLFRPLTLLSYRLDWLLHQDNPAGFHATNVLLHALNMLLLYGVARRLGAKRLAAAVGATLWALLPRLTECSAWISGRTDMLALAGVLCAFLLWPWPREAANDTRPLARMLGACGALFFGLLSKEVALAGLLALVAVELNAVTNRGRAFRFKAFSALAGTGLVYAALRIVALGEAQTPADVSHSLPWKVGRVFAAAGTYLVMLLTPWMPLGQIGSAWRYESSMVALGVLFVAVLVALCVAAWRRADGALLGAVVLGETALLSVLHILPLPSLVLASDRYLYVPTAAIAIAAALIASRLAGRRAIVAAGLAAPAAAGLAVGTIRRVDDWNDAVAFWSHTCVGADRVNFVPGAQLAILLDHAGYSDDALPLHMSALKGALTMKNNVRIATANLAESLARAGQYEKAYQAWREVTRMEPGLAHAWLRLGRMAAFQRDWGRAIAHTQRAALLAPEDPAAPRQLELIEVWRELEDALPTAASAQAEPTVALHRARTLTRLGRLREAEDAWRALLQQTEDAQILEEGLVFFAEMGGPRHATWALSMLARTDPRGESSAALRRSLEIRAQESARIERHKPGITACASKMSQQ